MKFSAIGANMRALDIVKGIMEEKGVFVSNDLHVDVVINGDVVPESVTCIQSFLFNKGFKGEEEVNFTLQTRGIGKSPSRSSDENSGERMASKRLNAEPARVERLDLEKLVGNWWTPSSKQGLIFYKEEITIEPRFIRQTHKALWNKLRGLEAMGSKKTHWRALVVKGHPGIGKTVFLDTLVAAIAHSYPKSPIVCVHLNSRNEPTLTLVLGDQIYSKELTRGVIREMIEENLAQNQGDQDGTVFVLHDVKSQSTGALLEYQQTLVPMISEQWPDRRIVLVLATSPARTFAKTYEQFLTKFLAQDFWVPMPTREECKLFVEKVNPETLTKFDEIHQVMGGAFRYYPNELSVIDANIKTYKQRCRAHVETMKYDPQYQSPGSDLASSFLVYPLVQDDGSDCAGYGFVSTFAWQTYMEDKDPKLLEKVLKLLQEGENTRDVYGRLFEQYCILRIKQQEAFSISPISSESVPGPLECFPHQTNSKSEFHGDTVAGIVDCATAVTLWIPTNDRFPVIDAAITVPAVDGGKPGIYLLQMTVAPEHRPTYQQWSTLWTELKSKNFQILGIIWMVDYHSKFKTYQSLDGKDGASSAKASYDSSAKHVYANVPQFISRISNQYYWVELDDKEKIPIPFRSEDTLSFKDPKSLREFCVTNLRYSVDIVGLSFTGGIRTKSSPQKLKKV